jgi:hypothetical protein
MIERYELRDETGELVRVFMSHEEAVKYMTEGDYLVAVKTPPKPKISAYKLAIKKVGYSLF